LTSPSWRTISAQDYQFAFERFGGSFAVHPRVVDLVCALADRPARYMGLECGTKIVAAAPLWGERVLATRQALEAYDASFLIDVGDAEVVLPVASDVRIELPFEASPLSSLHVDNIVNLERDSCAYPGRETISRMALAKGLRAGSCRQSAKSKKRRRLQIRRFEELGGVFHPLREFSADELAAVYRRLYRKRWGEGAFLLGEDHLRIVFRELGDMLFGDMLLFQDRPVAMELVYKIETSRWLLANGVQAGYDPEFDAHSIGSILLYHNLERLEEEAIAGGRTLRYSLGWSDAPYKTFWTYEEPAWRLRATETQQYAAGDGEKPASSASSLWRISRPVRRMASGLRLRAQGAAKALARIAAPVEPICDDSSRSCDVPAAFGDERGPSRSASLEKGIRE
jgi:hypothetical protein